MACRLRNEDRLSWAGCWDAISTSAIGVTECVVSWAFSQAGMSLMMPAGSELSGRTDGAEYVGGCFSKHRAAPVLRVFRGVCRVVFVEPLFEVRLETVVFFMGIDSVSMAIMQQFDFVDAISAAC